MWRSTSSVAALALSLLVLSTAAVGCAGSEPAPDAGPSGQAAPSLELELKLGCAECGDDRQITPTAVAFLDDGGVAVLDSWEPYVRVFDAAGNPRVAFGNQGQGPGEFGISAGTRPIPAAWIMALDGGVAVIDLFPPAVEAFDAAGRFREQRRLDLPPIPIDQAFDPVSRTYYRLGFDVIAGSGGGGILRCVLDLADEIGCDRVGEVERFISVPEEPRAPNADLGSLAIAATPSGDLVIADRSAYRIRIVDAGGDVVAETGREIPRQEKTPEEIEREREMILGDREVDPLHEHIEHNGVGVDGAGRIWVLTQRWTQGESVFDVFSPGGDYLGESRVDAILRRGSWAVAAYFLRDDRLAGIIEQADGSEQVWVWRIVDGAS